MIGQLTERCCWCFSLHFGSILVGVFLVLINILEIVHLIDKYDDERPDLNFKTEERRRHAIIASKAMCVVLIFIGVAVVIGVVMNKMKVVRSTVIALAIATPMRILTCVLRVYQGQSYDSFAVMMLICLIYVYFMAVLWSLCEEEAAIDSRIRMSDSLFKSPYLGRILSKDKDKTSIALPQSQPSTSQGASTDWLW